MKKTTTFGERLRQARIKAGFSQLTLAYACGWPRQSRISNYENGIRDPKVNDVQRICEVLNIETNWLAFGE